jgi:2-hydroxychromene-2-carboxylate isomerase
MFNDFLLLFKKLAQKAGTATDVTPVVWCGYVKEKGLYAKRG